MNIPRLFVFIKCFPRNISTSLTFYWLLGFLSKKIYLIGIQEQKWQKVNSMAFISRQNNPRNKYKNNLKNFPSHSILIFFNLVATDGLYHPHLLHRSYSCIGTNKKILMFRFSGLKPPNHSTRLEQNGPYHKTN